MAEQSYSGAPSRNASSAAGIPNKINVGSMGASKVTAANQGAAPHKVGPAVQGMSGTGVLPGKIKI